MPRLSCLPVSLFSVLQSGKMSYGQWMQEAESLEFDGCDVSTLFFRNRTPAYLEKIQREQGALPLVMMTSYPDFVHPDPVQAMRERGYFMSDIALASQLGCRYVRITPGPRHGEVSRKEGICKALDAFAAMAEYARAFGIQLVYENHAKPGCLDGF